MKTYNLTKTRDGQNPVILDTFSTIESARIALVEQMSFLDKGSDDQFIRDESARQNEIDFILDVADVEGLDAGAEVDKIKSWHVPCIVNMPTREEICNCDYDMFSYDVYTWRIEEVEE